MFEARLSAPAIGERDESFEHHDVFGYNEGRGQHRNTSSPTATDNLRFSNGHDQAGLDDYEHELDAHNLLMLDGPGGRHPASSNELDEELELSKSCQTELHHRLVGWVEFLLWFMFMRLEKSKRCRLPVASGALEQQQQHQHGDQLQQHQQRFGSLAADPGTRTPFEWGEQHALGAASEAGVAPLASSIFKTDAAQRNRLLLSNSTLRNCLKVQLLSETSSPGESRLTLAFFAGQLMRCSSYLFLLYACFRHTVMFLVQARYDYWIKMLAPKLMLDPSMCYGLNNTYLDYKILGIVNRNGDRLDNLGASFSSVNGLSLLCYMSIALLTFAHVVLNPITIMSREMRIDVMGFILNPIGECYRMKEEMLDIIISLVNSLESNSCDQILPPMNTADYYGASAGGSISGPAGGSGPGAPTGAGGGGERETLMLLLSEADNASPARDNSPAADVAGLSAPNSALAITGSSRSWRPQSPRLSQDSSGLMSPQLVYGANSGGGGGGSSAGSDRVDPNEDRIDSIVRILVRIYRHDLVKPVTLSGRWHRNLQQMVKLYLIWVVLGSVVVIQFCMAFLVYSELYTRAINRMHWLYCLETDSQASADLVLALSRLSPISSEHLDVYRTTGFDMSLTTLMTLAIKIESRYYLVSAKMLVVLFVDSLTMTINVVYYATLALLFILGSADKLSWLTNIETQVDKCIETIVDYHTYCTQVENPSRFEKQRKHDKLVEMSLIAYLNYALFKRQYPKFQRLANMIHRELTLFVSTMLAISYFVSVYTDCRLFHFVVGLIMSAVLITNAVWLISSRLYNRVIIGRRKVNRLLAYGTNSGADLQYSMHLWRRQLLEEQELSRLFAHDMLISHLSYNSMITLNGYMMAIWIILFKYVS